MKRFAMTVISTMFLIVAMNRDGQALGPWEKELYTSTIRGGIGTGYWEFPLLKRPDPRIKTTKCVPSGVLQKAPDYKTTMLWGDKLQLIVPFEHFAIFWEQIRHDVCGNPACSEIQIGDIARESAFHGDDGDTKGCHNGHKDGLRYDIRAQRKDGKLDAIRPGDKQGLWGFDYYSKEKTGAMLSYLTSSVHTECAFVYPGTGLKKYFAKTIDVEETRKEPAVIHLGVKWWVRSDGSESC